MLRMEIALVLVLGFVAYMYDSAERTRTALHRTFSALLAATLVHLVFDALTLYTVNHLDSVPKWLNDGLHRLFVGTMVLVVYLFYQYIAILVEEESGKPRKLDLAATLVHLVFDALTLYTVNHLDSVPKWLNDGLHRLFVGTMVLVVYLFYQYIAILVEEESGKPRKLDLAARVYLAIAEAGVLVLPVHYAVTPLGNYSDGSTRTCAM